MLWNQKKTADRNLCHKTLKILPLVIEILHKLTNFGGIAFGKNRKVQVFQYIRSIMVVWSMDIDTIFIDPLSQM